MTKRFVTTEHAVEKGLANTSPESGGKLVADWIKELAAIDSPGAKTLHGELQQLEKELKKDKPDAAHVKKILTKIGPETTKLADHCEDEAVGKKVRSLGEALTHSGA
jgi:hypothetical protein